MIMKLQVRHQPARNVALPQERQLAKTSFMNEKIIK
jgi:hypothetical protein